MPGQGGIVDLRGDDAGDPAQLALHRIAARGVSVQPWLGHSHADDGPLTCPVLYLVAADDRAPARWGDLEDWVRLPVESDELHARADRLVSRAALVGAVPMEVDDDVLRVGDSLVILSPLEGRLLCLLLTRRGESVSREAATAALWPDEPPADTRALDNRLKTLRQRISDLPLRIHTLRGRGLMLSWEPAAPWSSSAA